MMELNGMPIIVTEHATAALSEDKWDWSQYRSPSRAKRRRDRSKVITREPAIFQVGRRLVVHPVMWSALRKAAMSFDREMMKALEADGEKLRQLTGEDHGPVFLRECDCCGQMKPDVTTSFMGAFGDVSACPACRGDEQQ